MRRIGEYARHAARAAAFVALAGLTAGCEPLSLALLGVGGSVALNHRISSISSRTFTEPLLKVRTASIVALKRMGIEDEQVTQVENGEIITARLGKREIEVELESVTAFTTRMRVVARTGGLSYDGATATEIILQTEKGLGV